MRTLRIFFILVIAFNTLSAISFYGYLKEVVNASYLILYNKEWGYVDCRMWGIQSPGNVTKGSCDISDSDMNKMGFYARLEATRFLDLQQKYRIDIVGGRCVLYNGANFYHDQILKSGYGFVSKIGLKEGDPNWVRNLYKHENLAKQEKRGLWNDWPLDVACLRRDENKKAALSN